MRKLLLALPLVAGGAWAGTTYYSGTQTEPAYERLLAQLNQFKPFTVVAEEYNAGFIQSTAITKVTASPEADAEVLFRLQHVIDHSPVGRDQAGTRIGANSVTTTLIVDELPQGLQDVLNDKEPLVLHTRINLSGATVNELDIEEFAYSEDSKSVSFGGGHYEFVSGASGTLTGEGMLQAIEIVDENLGKRFEMAASPLKLDLQQYRPSLFAGSYSMDVPSMTITDDSAGLDVVIRDMQVSSDSDIEQGDFQGYMALSIAELDSPLPIDSGEWRLDMRGFSVEGLETYTETMQSIDLTDVSAGANPSDLADTMMDAYKALITPGIGITNKVSLRNEGGDITLSTAIDYKGDGSTTGTDNLQTIRDLVNALTAHVSLKADVDAVNMTPLAMMMGHPMATQYILNDGSQYTSELKVADLILDANGDPQSLDSMLGGMLEMPLDILQNIR